MKYIGKIDLYKIYEHDGEVYLKSDLEGLPLLGFDSIDEFIEAMHDLDMYDLMSRDEAYEAAIEGLRNGNKRKADNILACLRSESCKYFVGIRNAEPKAVNTLEDLVGGIGKKANPLLIREYVITYAPDTDITFILEEVSKDNGDPVCTKVVGFVYGEYVDDWETISQFIGSTTATY